MARQVMDVRQAADYLGCHVETVRTLARTQTLPAAKLGRRWRFRRRDLDEWLARGGTRYEALVDEGLSLAVSEAKADVAAGREKMVPWEEAKAALGL